MDSFEALHRRFLDRCAEDLAFLRQTGFAEGEAIDEIVATRIHHLSGIAGTFGYDDLSRLAGIVDARLNDAATPNPAERVALEHELRRVVSVTAP